MVVRRLLIVTLCLLVTKYGILMLSGVPLEKFEPLINFGIINSITKLHLFAISTESSQKQILIAVFLLIF
jgi:hypothetical protein